MGEGEGREEKGRGGEGKGGGRVLLQGCSAAQDDLFPSAAVLYAA